MPLDPPIVDRRWVVVWRDSVEWHETYCRERPLADAYAAKHHGVVYELAVVVRKCAGISSQLDAAGGLSRR